MADEVYRFSLEGDEIEDVLEDIYEHNSEAWAVGERKGVPVNSTDPTHQNNSKYWASFAADAAEGACIITDPNEDGNLVIEPPTGSESGWAVRYDAAQTLSEGQKAQARANIGLGGWLYLSANTDRTDANARKTAIATLYAEAKVTGIPVGAIRYDGGYYYSYIFTGRPHESSSSEVIYAYEQIWGGGYAINIWQLNNGSWSLVRTI